MTLPKRTDPTNATRQAACRRRQAQSHAQALAAKGLPAMPTIATLPGTSRWSAQQTLVLSILETMHDEMQDYFDERTEVWQEADRGQAMTQRIEAISDLIAAAEALEMA